MLPVAAIKVFPRQLRPGALPPTTAKVGKKGRHGGSLIGEQVELPVRGFEAPRLAAATETVVAPRPAPAIAPLPTAVCHAGARRSGINSNWKPESWRPRYPPPNPPPRPWPAAVAAPRWLILRRMSQLAILLAFLAGPVVRGCGSPRATCPRPSPWGAAPDRPAAGAADLVTGHLPYSSALIGRPSCSALPAGGRADVLQLVCQSMWSPTPPPASRRRLGIKTGRVPDAATRYWLLGGLRCRGRHRNLAWEWVNPVSLLHGA